MSARDPLDKFSPALRAQLESLERYYDRVAPRSAGKPVRRKARSQTQARPSSAPDTHHSAGGRRSLLDGRDLPAYAELHFHKRNKWQEWLWRTVVRETVALVAEVGPAGFTVRDLARRIGVARSTLYKYFGMKAELLAFCSLQYWWGGKPAHQQATERIAYRAALERLAAAEDTGAGGPLVADLLAEYVFAAGAGPERTLWLLTHAESVRAKRRLRMGRPDHESNPLRDSVRDCFSSLVRGGRPPTGEGTTGKAVSLSKNEAAKAAPAETVLAAVTYALEALTWYEASLNGAPCLDRPGQAPRILRFRTMSPWGGDLALNGGSPPPRRANPAQCAQAIALLLQGAGLGGQQLLPLPPLKQHGKLAMAWRQGGHPTGVVLHELQKASRQFDFDDSERLLPIGLPQTLPLDPPPRIPTGGYPDPGRCPHPG